MGEGEGENAAWDGHSGRCGPWKGLGFCVLFLVQNLSKGLQRPGRVCTMELL